MYNSTGGGRRAEEGEMGKGRKKRGRWRMKGKSRVWRNLWLFVSVQTQAGGCVDRAIVVAQVHCVWLLLAEVVYRRRPSRWDLTLIIRLLIGQPWREQNCLAQQLGVMVDSAERRFISSPLPKACRLPIGLDHRLTFAALRSFLPRLRGSFHHHPSHLISSISKPHLILHLLRCNVATVAMARNWVNRFFFLFWLPGCHTCCRHKVFKM